MLLLHRFRRQGHRPCLFAHELGHRPRPLPPASSACTPEELGDDDEVRDAAGELLNIMTGNFKSNLCDAGLDCKLEPPKVGITDDHRTPVEPGGGMERLAFRAGKINLFIEVTANPFMD